MSETNGGGVNYNIGITGDTGDFVKTMENIGKAFDKFDKSITSMGDKIDKAFSGLEKTTKSFEGSVNRLAKSLEGGMKGASKSTQTLSDKNKELSKTSEDVAKSQDRSSKQYTTMMRMLEGASRQVEKLSTSYSNMGADGERFIQPLTKALREYENSLQSANGDVELIVYSQEMFKNAVHDVQMEMSRYKAELKHTDEIKKDYIAQSKEAEKAIAAEQRAMAQQEKIAIQMANSINKAEREISNLTARMIGFGASEAQIAPLNEALERYRAAMQNAGGDATKTAAANREYANAIQDTKNSISQATDESRLFEASLENTTKAVQLALGPLSGIAARITAFTSLMKANTLAIASFVSSMTALVVATAASVRDGIEYERQMLSMGAAIEASAHSADITAASLSAMSEEIAESTLAATRTVRQASQSLLLYRNISVDMYRDILVAAQGMASLFGTMSIVEVTKTIGRALEAPAAGLDALREIGIRFTDQQKSQIVVMQNAGRTADAQALIMERFAVAQNLATKEAQGLAGALDTMNERILKIREQTAVYIQSNEKLGSAVNEVNKILGAFLEDSNRIEYFMYAIAKAIDVVVKGLKFFADNITTLIVVTIGVFTSAIVRSIVALTAWSIQFGKVKMAVASTGAFSAMSTAVTTLTTRFAILGAVMRSVAAVGALLSVAVPLLAGATAAYFAIRAFQEADSALHMYNRTMEESSAKSANFAKRQELYSKVLTETGNSAKYAAQELLSIANLDLSRFSETVQRFSEQNQSELSLWTKAGRTFGFGIWLDGFAKDIEDNKIGELTRKMFAVVNNNIKNGVKISEEQISQLQIALNSLGMTDVDVSKLIRGYEKAKQETEDLNKILENLRNGVKTGIGEINVDSLLTGLKDTGLDEVVFGVVQDMDVLRTAFLASEADSVSASNAAKQRLQSYRDYINAVVDDEQERVRQLAIVEEMENESVDRMMRLEDAYKEAANKEYTDYLNEVIDKSNVINSVDPVSAQKFIDAANGAKELAEGLGLVNADLFTIDQRLISTFKRLDATTQTSLLEALGMEEFDTATLKTTEGVKKFSQALYGVLGLGKQFKDFSDVIIDLENAFARAGASSSSAFKDIVDTQDFEKDVRNIKKSLEDIGSGDLQKLADMYGIVGLKGKELVDAIARQAAAANKASKANEESLKVYEKAVESMDDFTAGLSFVEDQYQSLIKNGVQGLEEAMQRQKVEEKIKDMTKAWSELTKQADKNVLIQKLQNLVTDGTVITSENYLEVLRKIAGELVATEAATENYKKALEDLNGEIESVLESTVLLENEFEYISRGLGAEFAQVAANANKIAMAFEAAGRPAEELRRLNNIFPDLFRDAENFESDMVELFSRQQVQRQWLEDWQSAQDEMNGIFQDGFNSIFTDGISGFKDMTEKMLDMFKRMLLDMIYEAAIKPIMVEVSAAVTGIFNPAAQGAGGQGGIGNALSLASLGKSATSALSSIGAMSNSITNMIPSLGAMDTAFWKLGDSITSFAGMKNLSLDAAAGLGALATAAAGMAGSWAGGTVFGQGNRKANSSWGATAGSMAGAYIGSIVPVIGTAIGSAIGGFIGSAVDVLFGSTKPSDKRQYAGMNLAQDIDDIMTGGFKGSKFSQEFQDQAVDLVKTFKLISEAIGGSIADINVSVGGRTGLSLEIDGVYQSFKEVEDFLEAGFQQIIQGATNIEPAVKEMAKGLEGEIESLIGSVLMLQEAYSKVPLDIDAIRSMQQYGEELVDTFVRVATNLAGVNDAFKLIGVPMLSIDQVGARVSERLVTLFGDLSNLSSAVGDYYERFFSEEERAKQNMEMLILAFGELNISMPNTNEQFRALVESLDLTTESGQNTFTSLMKIAPAFDEIVKANEAAARAAEEAAQAALDAERKRLDEMLAMAGISGDTIAKVLRDGMLARITADDVGQQLVEHIHTGIYNALASGFVNQIQSVMMSGIVEPMVQAAVTGSSISAAVSQAAIDNMIAQARAAAEALNAILNDPLFKSAMDQIAASFYTVGRIIAPRYLPTKPIQDLGNAMKDAADRARELEQATDKAFTDLEKYINAEKAAIADRLKVMEDAATNALAGFERNIDSQREALESAHSELMENLADALEPVKQSITQLQRNASSLKNAIDSVTLNTRDSQETSRNIAMQTLRGFLGTGVTNQTAFEDSLKRISENDVGYYSSFIDYARSQAQARSLFTELLNETEGQLTIEEQTLASLEEQIEITKQQHSDQMSILDQQLQIAQDAIDAMLGVDKNLYELQDVLNAVANYSEYQQQAVERLNELDNILNVAQMQLDVLRGIDTSIVDVATALVAFNKAVQAEAKFKGINIPGFASGGSFGGGIRLVGENGPEIEATGASRIFSARQSASALIDIAPIVDRLNSVVAELEHIRSGNVQVVKHTSRSYELQRKWDVIGAPVRAVDGGILFIDGGTF